MAAFAATSTLNNYQDREKSDDFKRLKDAMWGDAGDVSRKSANNILQQPDFIIKGTTDSNTAAASSPVISLSDYGVSFPAETYRDIEVAVVAANGSNAYRFRTRQRILGGTNPTAKGTEEFLTNCMAFYGMTTADGAATTEVAAECISPAWWDGAAPVAGAIASNTLTIQWLGTNSPVRVLIPGMVSHTDAAAAAADARSFQHGAESLTNGTSAVFISDVATPTAATFSNASAVRVSAVLFPPVHCPVLIDATPTPDEVIIGALGISSDVVTWNIRVFVSDPIYMPLV